MAHGVDVRQAADGPALDLGEHGDHALERIVVIAEGLGALELAQAAVEGVDCIGSAHALAEPADEHDSGGQVDELVLERRAARVEREDLHRRPLSAR